MMRSIWVEDVKPVHFDPLSGKRSTDVLIVGGGMVGLLCAHALTRAGVDCMLVEADRICHGITKNTTAKITVGHGLLYDRLIRQYGQSRAAMYLQAQRRACRAYEALCCGLDCDYEVRDAYVYSTNDRTKIAREIEALARLGMRVEFAEKLPIPTYIEGAVRYRDQATFHPLKFAYAIAKGLPIYEHTKVIELMPGRAVTAHGEIRCRRMIVATHFPILNKHGGYFFKMYQHRSYVLALRNAPLPKASYVDEDDKGLSFRPYGDLLLLGGGAHRTGKRGGGWPELEEYARTHYPQATVAARWATQDCMTLDRIPYIGPYAKSTPDLYVATGFNKWGMSTAMVAAELLRDQITGRANDCAEVFSPARSILHPQLAVNLFESAVHLLTPTAPRCPHLGCALKYNRAEHSWDCPCHGSRFTEAGELIDNPATDDIKPE